LDPFTHGPQVAEPAAEEIRKFYDLGIATLSERQFFDQALRNYRAAESKPTSAQQFWQHIQDNETVFHPDKAGQFEKLWPELNIAENNK
jgi:hypothetical protein